MNDIISNIEIRKWVKRGRMLYATDALDWDDKDHPYQQALAQGVVPEDFGIKSPLTERFSEWNRSQLMNRIVELEKELLAEIGYNSRG